MTNELKQGPGAKIIRLWIGLNLLNRMKEVAEDKSISLSEAIRLAADRYYNDVFRREKYGYQAGVKTASDRTTRASKKDQLEEARTKIRTLDDQALRAYLYEIGYLSWQGHWDYAPEAYFVGVQQETQLRGLLTQPSPDAAINLRLDMTELENDVIKYLKTTLQ